MSGPGDAILQVVCPCCNAILEVDRGTGAVKEWREPEDPRKITDLKDARKVLDEEKAAVEARFRAMVQADKEKGTAMERKFREFLEKGQGEASAKPLRDIDLD
ncbi:MAG: hypothetical protein OHK0028_08150 [Deltaproteobacteria bacterium]